MANGWSPERQARQAKLIRQWRPWEKSTGPKTQAVLPQEVGQLAFRQLDSNGTARAGGGHRGVTEIVRSLEGVLGSTFARTLFQVPRTMHTDDRHANPLTSAERPVAGAGRRTETGLTLLRLRDIV